ncbi:sister chromatid separation protein [Histoplasma ohiense]|nr:sister chromatid separation protein [Histoplasma ohiense (nom. inval.)]
MKGDLSIDIVGFFFPLLSKIYILYNFPCLWLSCSTISNLGGSGYPVFFFFFCFDIGTEQPCFV